MTPALVVVEVKARTGMRYGGPLEAVSRAKQARLRRLAVQWLNAHGVRFDGGTGLKVDLPVAASLFGVFTVQFIALELKLAADPSLEIAPGTDSRGRALDSEMRFFSSGYEHLCRITMDLPRSIGTESPDLVLSP